MPQHTRRPQSKQFIPSLGRPYHAVIVALTDSHEALLEAASKKGIPGIATVFRNICKDNNVPPTHISTQDLHCYRLVCKLCPDIADQLSTAVRARRGYLLNGTRPQSRPAQEPPVAPTSDHYLENIAADVAELKAQVAALARAFK